MAVGCLGRSDRAKDPLHPHGPELIYWDSAIGSRQPDAIESGGLQHDRVGSDGPHGARESSEHHAAKPCREGADEQQLNRGGYTVRDEQRIEDSRYDHNDQQAENPSEDLLDDARGVELIGQGNSHELPNLKWRRGLGAANAHRDRKRQRAVQPPDGLAFNRAAPSLSPWDY